MSDNKSEAKVGDISELFEVFGKYQIIQYMLICLPSLFVNMININYIFVAGDLNYRCRISECEGTNATVEHPVWWPNKMIDRCSRPVLRPNLEPGPCTNTSFTGELAACTKWIYESNNTVVAEMNLGCQPWKINMIGAIHNIGMLVSMVVSGWFADRFGRKPVLIFCVVGGCIGQLKTVTTSYYIYISIEFLEAAVTGGSYSAAMLLLLEIANKEYRAFSGVMFACYIYMGESLFALTAMFVPYWKNLVHIINMPSAFFISYIFIIHESPRWQIVSGRLESAKVSLNRIAKTNNINIDYNELANITENQLQEKLNIKDVEVEENIVDIFLSKELMKRLLVSCVCRFTSNFVYYGLMINSVWLPGNKYVNFFLSTVMSFPGELISMYLMNRIGRKMPLMIGYIMSGVMCVVSAYIPDSYMWLKIAAFLVGKVIISACFTGTITYTMELFPTSVRGSMFGICSFTNKVGGLLAPLTPIMNDISPVLPSVCFGVSAVFAGGLLTLTPETKNLPLMDTIRQVDNSVKKNAQEV